MVKNNRSVNFLCLKTYSYMFIFFGFLTSNALSMNFFWEAGKSVVSYGSYLIPFVTQAEEKKLTPKDAFKENKNDFYKIVIDLQDIEAENFCKKQAKSLREKIQEATKENIVDNIKEYKSEIEFWELESLVVKAKIEEVRRFKSICSDAKEEVANVFKKTNNEKKMQELLQEIDDRSENSEAILRGVYKFKGGYVETAKRKIERSINGQRLFRRDFNEAISEENDQYTEKENPSEWELCMNEVYKKYCNAARKIRMNRTDFAKELNDTKYKDLMKMLSEEDKNTRSRSKSETTPLTIKNDLEEKQSMSFTPKKNMENFENKKSRNENSVENGVFTPNKKLHIEDNFYSNISNTSNVKDDNNKLDELEEKYKKNEDKININDDELTEE